MTSTPDLSSRSNVRYSTLKMANVLMSPLPIQSTGHWYSRQTGFSWHVQGQIEALQYDPAELRRKGVTAEDYRVGDRFVARTRETTEFEDRSESFEDDPEYVKAWGRPIRLEGAAAEFIVEHMRRPKPAWLTAVINRHTAE